jgi:hypothetical protein
MDGQRKGIRNGQLRGRGLNEGLNWPVHQRDHGSSGIRGRAMMAARACEHEVSR